MVTPRIKGKAAPVSFQNVSKVFGKDVVAVDDVSFEVEAGKLVTLLGPSGCGKTTTLRMIAGLEMATSGRILIGDKDVTRCSGICENSHWMVSKRGLNSFGLIACFDRVLPVALVCRGQRITPTWVSVSRAAVVGVRGYDVNRGVDSGRLADGPPVGPVRVQVEASTVAQRLRNGGCGPGVFWGGAVGPVG